jgi:hypothetical protein
MSHALRVENRAAVRMALTPIKIACLRGLRFRLRQAPIAFYNRQRSRWKSDIATKSAAFPFVAR